jgi:lysophospholipase L1-like esterase
VWQVVAGRSIPDHSNFLPVSAWQESETISVEGGPIELTKVPLDDPDLRFEGISHVETSQDSVRFSRFTPEQLRLGKPQLGFNPDKARNAAGGVVAFRTGSPLVRLSFQPLEGLNRGSEFGIFADGVLVTSHRFGPREQELVFELESSGASPVDWEVSLPSFADVELIALEVDASRGLTEPAVSERKTLVALGDSITHGTGQGSASHLSWPFLLSRQLGYELFNLAVGGSGVSIAAAQSLAGFEPVDAVTVLFGYNDWNGEGNSVGEFMNEYRQMLSELRAVQPDAAVFCISPLVTRRDVSKSTGLPIDGFREAVRELVQEWRQFDPGIHFIDGTEISSFENLQPEGSKDVVHLTVEGAAMLADSLFPIIEAQLQ